jgi:hypothetical protein
MVATFVLHPILSQSEEIPSLLRGRRAIGIQVSKEVFESLLLTPARVDILLTMKDTAGKSLLVENVPVLAVDSQAIHGDVLKRYVTVSLKLTDCLKLRLALKFEGEVTAIPHQKSDAHTSP